MLLQIALALLPVPLYARSERFHATVLAVFFLDFLMFRRQHVRWGYPMVAAIGLTAGLGFFFWNLLDWQARAINGRFQGSEVLWRMSLVASLVILYSWWTRALMWLLERKASSEFKNSPRGLALRALRIGVSLLLFAPYFFTAMNSHRFKIAGANTPRSDFKLEYEDVAFKANDGIPLRGWLIPAPNSQRAVVVCHGLGANRGLFLGVAPFLQRAGYTVLMFDFRGHGDSGGHTISFGADEARDVAGAVSFLKARGFSRVALYGFSMGGAAVLNSAAKLPVDAVVVDSTFTDFAPLVAQNLPSVPQALKQTAVTIIDIYGQLEVGASLHQISTRTHIASISPRPLLVVHGTGDQLIPFSQAQTIHRLAQHPKQLWLVKGADHCLCRLVDVKRYEARVSVFLKRAIR